MVCQDWVVARNKRHRGILRILPRRSLVQVYVFKFDLEVLQVPLSQLISLLKVRIPR